jgi:hypothetical protein
MEETSELLKIRVSDTARAAATERFGYLPPDALEVAAGYLTLIEEVDAKHKQRADPDIDYATALQMSEAFAHQPPWKQEQMRREWMEERETFVQPFVKFLSLYPAMQPIHYQRNEKTPDPN